MKILKCGNKAIVRAVAESEEISRLADDLESVDMNRFPTLIEVCLGDFPGLIHAQFSFLPEMLRFTGHSSVGMMFEKLIQPGRRMQQVCAFLNEMDFPGIIARKGLEENDEDKFA